MEIKNNLQKYRLQAGLTQKQLAELAKVHLRTLQCYEQGTREPAVTPAIKLARVLKIEIDKIWEVENDNDNN